MVSQKNTVKNHNRLPNLLNIGVHKAGTTSLYEYLSAHPNIFCPLVKEIHYFTELIYSRPLASIDKYHSFYTKSNKPYRIDCSPSYYYAEERVIQEMKNILGNFKIVLVLREPKARIISYYKNQIKRVKIPHNESLNEFLRESLPQAKEYLITGDFNDSPHNRGVRESLYGHYLKRWFNNFNNEDIMVLYFEDLVSDTTNILNSICEWLEIEKIYHNGFEYAQHNKAMAYKNKFIHKYSVKYFRKYESLIRRSGLKQTISSIYNTFNSKILDADITISDHLDNELNKLINKDLEILKTILLENSNQPLPVWLKNE